MYINVIGCLKTESEQHRLEGNILDFNPHISYDIHNNQSRITETDTIHPATAESFIDQGTLIEINVTNSTGRTISSNVRINSDDMEFLQSFKNILNS